MGFKNGDIVVVKPGAPYGITTPGTIMVVQNANYARNSNTVLCSILFTGPYSDRSGDVGQYPIVKRHLTIINLSDLEKELYAIS